MIILNDIVKKFGNKVAIDHVNVCFTHGLTCIVGESGSGKSTLLNLIGGIDEPTSGTITICQDDQSVLLENIEDYQRDYLGFVFQDANLINGLSVIDNLKIAAEISNVNFDKIEEVTDKLGLRDLLTEKVENISGGERIRVSIARAILKDVPLILADEPTGSLDSMNSEHGFQLLKELSQTRIVIVVTHNLELAHKYSDRIIMLRDGKIVSDIANNVENNNIVQSIIGKKREGRLSTETVNKLTFNNILRFKAKFISMAIAISLSLSAIGIIYALGHDAQGKTDLLNSLYYEADMVTIYERPLGEKTVNSIVTGESVGVISDKIINDVEDSDLFEEIVPVYEINFQINQTEDSIDYKTILLDDFFENRIMTNNVEGSFPSTAKQIIIGKDVAEKFYNGNAIGKTISLMSDYGISEEFDVVGINSEKNVDGVYLSYIPYDSISRLKYKNMMIYIYTEENVENLSKVVYTEDASGIIVSKANEDILYGRVPEKENEIAISTEIARNLYYSSTGEEIDISSETLVNPSSKILEALTGILNENYYIEANNTYPCTIVGIHDGISYNVITTEQWLEQLTGMIPNYIECYCYDIEAAKNFSKTNLANSYPYVSNYEERFENAVAVTRQWSIIFVLSLCIVLIICILLLHSYAKIVVTERLYESGILLSLGMRNIAVRKLLSKEISVLGIGSSIIAGVITWAGLGILNEISSNANYGYIVFVLPIVIATCGSVITVCVALAETKTISTLKIATALRTRI